MAAANAQIGVARAAYFPSLNLSPVLGGYESNSLASLISVPSLVWSVGVQSTQTLFDGGRIRAGVDFAQAGYVAALANYRQAVLVAIQEAQDALGEPARPGVRPGNNRTKRYATRTRPMKSPCCATRKDWTAH